MSSCPSRISQPSAKLNDPSNGADLPLKSHCDFVEKAHAAELEKARVSKSLSGGTNTLASPPPQQAQSPCAASVEDDHNDDFQPDSEGSNNSSQAPTNNSQAISNESNNKANDINNNLNILAKHQENPIFTY